MHALPPLMATANDKNKVDARWQAQGQKSLETTINSSAAAFFSTLFAYLCYLSKNEFRFISFFTPALCWIIFCSKMGLAARANYLCFAGMCTCTEPHFRTKIPQGSLEHRPIFFRIFHWTSPLIVPFKMGFHTLPVENLARWMAARTSWYPW